MHARYFSAHLGRFQSVDPLGVAPEWPQSWNRYSYVLGNPMKYTDPYGLYWNLFQQVPNPFLFYDQTTVTSTGKNLSLFFSVLGLLSGPGSSSSPGAFQGGGPASQKLTVNTSPRCNALVPQPVPPTADLAANIQEAKQHSWNLFWLANQVKTGARWDFKRQGQSQFEAFGNFHYGVVFSAGGIPPGISLAGAGIYQIRRGTSTFDWVFPYGAAGLFDPMNPFHKPIAHFPFGDDPTDAAHIMHGILFYEECVQ